MVSEFFLEIIFTFIDGIFRIVPDFTWDVTSDLWRSAIDVVCSIAYLLPVGTIARILALSFIFLIIRIVISFIKTIWGLLPVV